MNKAIPAEANQVANSRAEIASFLAITIKLAYKPFNAAFNSTTGAEELLPVSNICCEVVLAP